MSKLSDSATSEIDSFWAAETRCSPDDFETNTVGIVELPAPDCSEYALLFRRKQRLQITCSGSLVDLMQEATRGFTPETIFSAGFVRQVLDSRIDRVVGPAYLGYLDSIDAGFDRNVRLLDYGDRAALDDLRRCVSARDWEYSGLEAGQPIAGYFVDDKLVSAAGYEVWGARIAHVGVLTRVEARGAGYGRACIGAIASYAIGQGLIAQYRTLYENAGAMAIARALGFVDYGATIYVAATTTSTL